MKYTTLFSINHSPNGKFVWRNDRGLPSGGRFDKQPSARIGYRAGIRHLWCEAVQIDDLLGSLEPWNQEQKAGAEGTMKGNDFGYTPYGDNGSTRYFLKVDYSNLCHVLSSFYALSGPLHSHTFILHSFSRWDEATLEMPSVANHLISQGPSINLIRSLSGRVTDCLKASQGSTLQRIETK